VRIGVASTRTRTVPARTVGIGILERLNWPPGAASRHACIESGKLIISRETENCDKRWFFSAPDDNRHQRSADCTLNNEPATTCNPQLVTRNQQPVPTTQALSGRPRSIEPESAGVPSNRRGRRVEPTRPFRLMRSRLARANRKRHRRRSFSER
jgi:hypothetical protein